MSNVHHEFYNEAYHRYYEEALSELVEQAAHVEDNTRASANTWTHPDTLRAKAMERAWNRRTADIDRERQEKTQLIP